MKDPIFSGDYATVYHHLPDAACRGKSTDLFFSQDSKEIRQAKRICRGCPERERCLGMAITNAEGAGVWGGVMFRRGRPDANDMEYWRLRSTGENGTDENDIDENDIEEYSADEETVGVSEEAPVKAAKKAKSVTKKNKAEEAEKANKNGRSAQEGFSRYPMPTRTVLPQTKKK